MESINDDLVKAIKEKTSNGSTAAILSDILYLNSEAIYRRLRGQVPFTLDETIKICRHLNISLDLIAGIKNQNKFAFHLDTFLTEDPLQEYCDMLLRITKSMEPLKNDPSTRLYRAHKTIPQEFLYNYEKLSNVYTYILYYQLYSNKPANVKKMSELVLPKGMYSRQKESVSTVHDFESMLILDQSIVYDFINIVKFFFDLKMISQEDIKDIKKELFLLVADMEKCADTGRSLMGKPMHIYLCNISFDTNYSCMESDNFSVSSLGIYCIDYLSCENGLVFNIHKSWILSLLKFSMLISVADEITRKNFFHKQREYIERML